MRFGDNDLKETVKKCNDIVARRIEEARKKAIYESALEIMEAEPGFSSDVTEYRVYVPRG